VERLKLADEMAGSPSHTAEDIGQHIQPVRKKHSK